MSKLLYMAHPVAGDVPGNTARAKRWLRWLYHHLAGAIVIAPWLLELEVLPLRDHVPEEREAGLRRDEAVVMSCDGIVLVGGALSHGMSRELAAAHAAGLEVINLLHLGPEPPEEG